MILCVAVAAAALALGYRVPVVGGPVFAIVIGTIVAAARKPGDRFRPGITFASKTLLQAAIVVLGLTLGLRQIVGNGIHSLPVMLGTLVVTLVLAYVFGRVLRIERDLRRLLGIGTAICGGSAIAALSSVIGADDALIAYAISTVFLFNVVAVLTFPWLGHALALSQHAFGLWAGTAINDTSSVVAAAFVYGHAAGSEAVIAKLTRTTLIIPIVLYYATTRLSTVRRVDWRKIVPWFIVWFILAALVNTFGLVPPAIHPQIVTLATVLITVALAGVGLCADFVKIRAAGFRPLLLGLVLWVGIAVSSLFIARLAHLG